jgi:VWFA-related protein
VSLTLFSAASWSDPAARAPTPKFRIEQLGQVDSTDLKNITVRFRVVDEKGEPAKNLPDQEFRILEDGQEVLRFPPAGLRSQAVSTVLTLDTSGSMDRQNRMAEAKRAAERFFDKLDERTPCGLVLFHHETYRRESLHADKGELRALVRAAKPAGGTAYLNATYDAIQLLADTDSKHRRAVVLMTDGRDVNSKRTLSDVVREAREKQVRVYTLGLGLPGQQQPVRSVMVLDRSGSMNEGGKMDAMKKAARRFINLIPGEGADTTIIAFDFQIPAARPFTNDRHTLLQQIDQLSPRGGTKLYDATYEGIETLNASLVGWQGRKPIRALVAMTDGKDENSHRQPEDVIQRALRDEIRIHMIGLGRPTEINEPVMRKIAQETGGEYFPVPDTQRLTDVFENLSITLHDDGVDETSLRKLAEETGGEYYLVRDADRLAGVFERVASQLESTYEKTFISKRARHDGTARRIEILFGDMASSVAAYTTHGLITPKTDHLLYLGLLGSLCLLVLVPTLFRRRPRTAT